MARDWTSVMWSYIRRLLVRGDVKVSVLLAGIAKLKQPKGQRLCKVRTQQKKLMGQMLSLYYEESQVSSNLNSKRFHCVRPSVSTTVRKSHAENRSALLTQKVVKQIAAYAEK